LHGISARENWLEASQTHWTRPRSWRVIPD
jgi:hypothetical protein